MLTTYFVTTYFANINQWSKSTRCIVQRLVLWNYWQLKVNVSKCHVFICINMNNHTWILFRWQSHWAVLFGQWYCCWHRFLNCMFINNPIVDKVTSYSRMGLLFRGRGIDALCEVTLDRFHQIFKINYVWTPWSILLHSCIGLMHVIAALRSS